MFGLNRWLETQPSLAYYCEDMLIHVFSQVLYYEYLGPVYLAPGPALIAPWVGWEKGRRTLGKNICYVSYIEIYILQLLYSENITIST